MQDAKLNLLSQAMLAYNRRIGAIAGNIANLDTPGYQRVEIDFEEKLQGMLHSPDGVARAGEIMPTTRVSDEAPVLEDELMNMADTQMRTQLASKALHEHFGLIRTAIIGRAG